MTRSPLTTYLKLCTEFYDLENHPYDTQAQDFYMAYALQADGPILEPMCGTGRFLIPMLQADLDIEGFDASSEMLEACKNKLSQSDIKNHEQPVWQEFIQDFSSDRRYALIFIPYGSWGLIIDKQDVQQALTSMYDHLLPGGKFVLDIETTASAPQQSGIERRSSSNRTDGSRIQLSTISSYNPDTQIFRSLCRYDSLVNKKVIETETENFTQYLYRFNELDTLLLHAGFKSIACYQDYGKTPIANTDSSLIIYECTK